MSKFEKKSYVINKLVEYFTEVPRVKSRFVRKSERPCEGIYVLDFSLVEKEMQERQKEIVEFIKKDGKGCFDESAVLELFSRLEEKAINKINDLTVLAVTSDPDKEKEQLTTVPDDVIEAKKKTLGYGSSVRSSNMAQKKHKQSLEACISDVKPIFEELLCGKYRLKNLYGKFISINERGAQAAFLRLCHSYEDKGVGYGDEIIKKAFNYLRGK